MNDYNEDDYQESGKIRDQKRKERETQPMEVSRDIYCPLFSWSLQAGNRNLW